MQRISIEMLSRGEPSTARVLKSIEEQTFKDYDITCVNSSGNPEISDLLHEFKVKEIVAEPSTKHLEARYLAHINSSGKFRLLLDSTRPLEPNALELLISKYSGFKAVCIREGSLGQGFWVKQADLLRSSSEMLFKKTVGNTPAYILPRFYRSEILDEAFKFLKSVINVELFKKIGYGEHHLIYDAAKLKSSEIAITDEILLKHFEDSSARMILRKYTSYGKSQRTLNMLSVNLKAKKLSSHRRPLSRKLIIPMTKTVPLRLLRVSGFLLGYLF